MAVANKAGGTHPQEASARRPAWEHGPSDARLWAARAAPAQPTDSGCERRASSRIQTTTSDVSMSPSGSTPSSVRR